MRRTEIEGDMSETGPGVSVLRRHVAPFLAKSPVFAPRWADPPTGEQIAEFRAPMSDNRPVPSPAREASRPSRFLWACIAVWLFAVAAGLSVVWAWENTPGAAGDAPARWPADSGLSRAGDAPTLILFAHPQCSCTRASLGEFAETLARATTRPRTYVVFLKPVGLGVDWEKTDLWRAAERLPGVTVMRDDEGREAKRFGVITSGQTMLYDESGDLIFSGGITGARGHAGDNAGRASLISLLNQGRANLSSTSVFGCPLFAFLD